MKKILIMAILALMSCEAPCDHNCIVNKKFPELKRPIIVVAKKISWGGGSVVVRDSVGTVLLMGNLSTIGNLIAESYNVGDTIK